MALIVHKYGGTSMGSTERIRNVAKRVAKWARAGHQMVVVPSAMSGETNRLLGLAKELAPAKSTDAVQPRARHAGRHRRAGVVGLLAIALQAEGMESVSYAGWQVPIKHQQRLHQGPHRVDRRPARARRPGRRQGGHRHRLPGRGRAGQHHHPGPRRQRHLGRGRGRRHEGRTNA
jgi:aspartokinase